MTHRIVLVAGFAALAACNKSPGIHEKNASVGDVVNAAEEAGVANDTFLQAGQWRVTGTVDEMTIPGLPASAQAEMKKMMGAGQNYTVEYCLSPEEAKRPRGKFLTGKDSKNCRYEHFDMAGGKVDALMRCEGEPSGSMTMSIKGTYSPNSYSNNVAMESTGGREGRMTMKMHSEARRIGECSEGDAKVAAKGE